MCTRYLKSSGCAANALARGAEFCHCILKREILEVLIATQRDEQESSDCGQSTSDSNDMHVLCVWGVGMDTPFDWWGKLKVWDRQRKRQTERDRKRQRERDSQRQTETERERERERQTDRQRKRERERERERERQTDRQRKRQTERDRQRETETRRDRERQTETERERAQDALSGAMLDRGRLLSSLGAFTMTTLSTHKLSPSSS
eukprot:586639-Rhodomonas_salina.2